MSQSISIQMTFASLPEGWKGSPESFKTWLSENAEFTATGAFLTGQIGGPRPTSNVGLYVNGTTLEAWNGTEYAPISTVPVGAVFDFPSQLSAPEYYLFCQNQLLNQADYPKLYAVLGRTWCKASDASDKFRLPDYRGRNGLGAGQGEYKNASLDASGVMADRVIGTYLGAEWIMKAQKVVPGAGSPRYSPLLAGSPTSSPAYVWNTSSYHGIMNPCIVVQKIIRVR